MLEELRLSDLDGSIPQIDIPEPQARDLSDAQASAVGEHQHCEQPDRAPRGFRRRVRECRLQYSLYFLVCVDVGRAVILTRCSSNTIADEQDRHAWIEPVHGFRDDATGQASVKETRG
jgi:hypothetical protein